MPLPDKEFTADEFTQVLEDGLKGFQEKLGAPRVPTMQPIESSPMPPMAVSEVIHKSLSAPDRELGEASRIAPSEAPSSDIPLMAFEAAVAGATATVYIPASYTVP